MCQSQKYWLGKEFKQKMEKQESFGMVVFHLFDKVVLVTTRNFRELGRGQKGFGNKNALVQRVIPSFLIQAGDFLVEGNLESAQSIYGLNFKGGSFYFLFFCWSLDWD